MIEISYESPLHRGQRRIWDEFVSVDAKNKRCVANIARQWGKTTLCKRAALYWAIEDPGCDIGWISPEASHFYKPFAWFRDNLNDIIQRADAIKNVIFFKNKSRLFFFSCNNYDAIRGQTFDYRIMDEFGFGRFGQTEAIAAYGGTFVAKGKKDLIVSTPNGKNQMYDAYTTALNRDDELAVTAKSSESPFVSLEFLEEMRQGYPDWLFRQEYEAEFIEGASGVFGTFSKNCTSDKYLPEYNGECYLGVDIALGGEDLTSAVILSKDGTVINREEWRESNTQSQINRIAMMLDAYNVKAGFIENNTERGIAQAINRMHRGIKEWTTTRKNKPDMIQNLKLDLENEHITLPTSSVDPTLFHELSSFEGVPQGDGYVRYGHPIGGHDDSVISLALANEARVPGRYTNVKLNTGYKLKTRRRPNFY